MSWDVMIFKLKGETPPPLEGLQEATMTRWEPLRGASPNRKPPSRRRLVRSDLGFLRRRWVFIEFNVGDEDPIANMMSMSGAGRPISAFMTIVRPLGWSALDCSTGEFLNVDDPSGAGLSGFQAFRDRSSTSPVTKARAERGHLWPVKFNRADRSAALATSSSTRRSMPRLPRSVADPAAGDVVKHGGCYGFSTRISPTSIVGET